MRVLLPVLLAAGSTLAAQTMPQARTVLDAQTAQIIAQSAPGAGCPVAFSVRRSPEGALVQTRREAALHELKYEVHLGGSRQHPGAITAARITLHGLDGARVVPVLSDADGLATEGFSLSPAQAEEAGLHSLVYTHKLTGVQTVELNELTFADGTRWHESAEAPCRIAPNGFLQVASLR